MKIEQGSSFQLLQRLQSSIEKTSNHRKKREYKVYYKMHFVNVEYLCGK